MLLNQNLDIRFIAAGSNLLINDEKRFENVCSLLFFNNKMEYVDGKFIVGASVRLQHLIHYINNYGYGGIEYLYSVPGTLGGAIYMNAGRGSIFNDSIGNYIVSVTTLYKGKRYVFDKDDCKLSYRDSVFKYNHHLIIECTLSFPEMSKDISQARIHERIEYCKQYQDNSAPNFGTVFISANPKLMKAFKFSFLGRCGDICYSSKCPNWMLNKGGTFKQAVKLLKRAEFLHKIFFKTKPKREVELWY